MRTLEDRLQRKFNQTLKDYALVEDGDKILVALSGGKDSMALLDFFVERRKIYKPKFELLAMHVSVDHLAYQSDLEYLKAYCEEREVEFIHIVNHFEQEVEGKKSPCFICSWNRRKSLFKEALKHDCNKIAFGHHMDDILETLLMNQIFQGAFATMPPKLKMNKFEMELIRPMCLLREADIQILADQRNYRKQIINCPYEEASNRPEVRKILYTMERLNPNASSSLWNSMMNVQDDYLPVKNIINKK